MNFVADIDSLDSGVEATGKPDFEFAPGIASKGSAFPSAPVSADPAERLEFSRVPAQADQRFDTRSDQDLRHACFAEADAIERERAIWELADRIGPDALALLLRAAHDEPDSLVRRGLLWLIQRVGQADAVRSLAGFRDNADPEVADWADLLSREITGESRAARDRESLRFDEKNPFDQTLPLVICGYARTLVPGIGWLQVTLSPKWFESIMGRVMACTRRETFASELVIEKNIRHYHPDGTDHLEIYPFRGFTHDIGGGMSAHYYQSETVHTFYPSGKVEDISIPPVGGVVVNIQRTAVTVPLRIDVSPRVQPNFLPTPSFAPSRGGADQVVESVRGRYMGAAFVNLERIFRNGMRIGPGEVQLSTFHHPDPAVCANTHLYGAFKGKLSDLDGDGLLDVNTERCHGTLSGQLDRDLDGIADRDPFDAIA